jgi:hypothetical protein
MKTNNALYAPQSLEQHRLLMLRMRLTQPLSSPVFVERQFLGFREE